MRKQTVIEMRGAVHIRTLTEWRDAHIRIYGDLVFDKGGVLIADNCTIELAGSFSRELNYRWRGGTLISRDTTLGGTRQDGRNVQVNMELHHGDWYATDTTVRYCYGIIFGSGEYVGRLRAVRLKGGPNPDSIIMTGRGDVVLKDSSYMISLSMYVDKGGQGLFDLPIDTPVNRVFDATNVPGAQYRLELVDTSVSLWFLFANNVTMDGPSVDVLLRRCPRVITCLVGKDIRGRLCLPCFHGSPFPADHAITTGNVTWRTEQEPPNVLAWGVYLQGDGSDLTLLGPGHICELIVWGGNLNLLGSEGTHDMWAQGTTIEVGDFSMDPSERRPEKEAAQITMRNVRIGMFTRQGLDAPGAEDGIVGQITAHNRGHIMIENALCDELMFRTYGSGSIIMRQSRRDGEFSVDEQGGPISLVAEGT
jgi:hypothetical protein